MIPLKHVTVAGGMDLNGVSNAQACKGGSDNTVVKSTEAAMANAAGVPVNDVSVSVTSCDQRRGSRRGLSVSISFAVCLQQ